MTTATRVFSWTNTNTDSSAREWASGVKALFLAAGLTQTTDTGQADPATIVSTTGANYLYGYNIFKFDDALQASMPIFIKVQYMTNSNGTAGQIEFSVGQGTNGAGALSGAIFGPYSNSYAFLSPQTGLTSYASYGDGTFACVLGYGAYSGLTYNNHMGSLIVDRARNSAGDSIGNGFLCELSTSASTNPVSRPIYSAASLGPSYIPASMPNGNATTSSEGANVNVFRHYAMTPGVHPSLGSLTYFSSDFGALTPVTVPILGEDHTYLPMGNALNYWSANGSSIHCGMIRWE